MAKYHQFILLAALGCMAQTITGCSTIGIKSDQHQQLAKSVQLLQTGNQHQASNILEQVIATTPEDGVTDEALFRLALLQLTEETVRKGSTARSQALLERLRTEYPDSPWTQQSKALTDWLTGTRTAREQANQLLRENRDLARENRELRQNMERLKNLDLEIEQKRKR